MRYLVHLSDRDVPFFRVSFLPIFSRRVCQKKAIFLEPVVKTCQKGKFVKSGYYLVQFCVLEHTFTDIFQDRVSFEGKNSGTV